MPSYAVFFELREQREKGNKEMPAAFFGLKACLPAGRLNKEKRKKMYPPAADVGNTEATDNTDLHR